MNGCSEMSGRATVRVRMFITNKYTRARVHRLEKENQLLRSLQTNIQDETRGEEYLTLGAWVRVRGHVSVSVSVFACTNAQIVVGCAHTSLCGGVGGCFCLCCL